MKLGFTVKEGITIVPRNYRFHMAGGAVGEAGICGLIRLLRDH